MEPSHYSSDLDPSSVLGFGSALALLDSSDEVGRLLTGALRSMGLADLQAVVLNETLDDGPLVVGSAGTKALSDSALQELRTVENTVGLRTSEGIGGLSHRDLAVDPEMYPTLADIGIEGLSLVRLGTIDRDFGIVVAGHVAPDAVTSMDRSVLQMLAAQVSMALHRIQLNRQRRAKAAALEESEARYRTLYESAPVAYASVTPEGEIRMVNQRATELLGAPKDALIGRKMPHLCIRSTDDEAAAKRGESAVQHTESAVQHLQRHLEDGGPMHDAEVELCRADGERVWVSLTMRPIAATDDAERLVMMIDITERKHMETALREARDDLEARVDERTAELREANEQLKQQAKRLEALRDVDRAILAAESPAEIASVAARRAQDIVPCERVSVSLFDWDEEQVRVLTAHQEDPVLESGTTFPIDEFTLNDRLRAGEVDDMPDFDTAPSTAITERLRAAGIQSAITVPMMVEDDLIGTVNLGSTEAQAFCEAERRIGRELADHLAIALRQARLLEAVQEQRARLEERVAARTAELQDANAALTEENVERRRVEQALRESRERLTRIIDSAIDAIISVDADLNITLFNEAAEEIFRCASTEAECTTMDAFLSESFEALVRRHIEAYQKSDDDVVPEGRYLTAPNGLEARRADGDAFPVEATLCPVQLPDEDRYLLILRDLDDLKQAEAEVDQLQSEKSYLQEELKSEYNFDEIVGTSAPMQTVFDAIERVADTETTVLITGETGTGKELVARALHDRSARADEVFVKVNCAALSSDLIESELFGHERGAFTGATEQREGRFELADGGTLLLDEIGELPLGTQAKLLRVLQHQEFERVGGSTTIEVDTRILAATNRDLTAEVDAGQFRDDLYYRLNIFPIELPPLRDRPGDIPLLAEHFRETFAQRTGKAIEGITSTAMAVLEDYDWPGNVRELANIIERAVILTREPRIRAEHLSISGPTGRDGPASFDTLADAQRRHIERALKRTDGVVGGEDGAAQLLDVKRTTLLSRMDRLGIDPEEYRT
ncbi:hypothetical protein BSZ35_12820 [Salinibacter sp. 10B]|uniref:sigma 54-interacting transcriptional regulator n=1 Tax=Salinibacter sp. 10B TaxID=1923971 RepID=UPI000CF3A209|nr:sigma 54-interacting transcriptional regulator [Salinibacter sp. 10B]PQJ35363.1 hypothetical protein BSZ35_12820 [Salinibacter sp. 10B]